jgi:hypothetical protein
MKLPYDHDHNDPGLDFGNRNTDKPVLRGHLWDKDKMVFQDSYSLKRDSIPKVIFYDRTRKR